MCTHLVGMSIHVHACKYVSVCAETHVGMAILTRCCKQRLALTRCTCIQSTEEKWKLRPGPDSPGHKAGLHHRLNNKAKCTFPPTRSVTYILHPWALYLLLDLEQLSVLRNKPLGLQCICHRKLILPCLIYHKAWDLATSSILVIF